MLRVLSQVASVNVFAQPSGIFSVGLLRTMFQVPNYQFSSLWQHGRGKYNVSTATENFYIATKNNLLYLKLNSKVDEYKCNEVF